MADVVHVVSKCSFSFSAVSHNEKLFPPFLCNAFKFVAFAEVHDKAATSNKKRGKKRRKRQTEEAKRAQESTRANFRQTIYQTSKLSHRRGNECHFNDNDHRFLKCNRKLFAYKLRVCEWTSECESKWKSERASERQFCHCNVWRYKSWAKR